MKSSILAAFVLLAACSTGAPGNPSPVPPTLSPTPTPTFAPTALGTPSATPSPSPASSAGYSCDPDMGYGCDHTPAPTGAATGATVNASPDGSFLVGPSGMTLYYRDSDSPDHSSCMNADCSGAWPALSVTGGGSPTAGEGVTGTLTTFDRGNGIMQVQYNGMPLYSFVGDSAPGDTTGTSVSGWHLAAP
ncbi:MAG: hypothetical protein ABI744_04905 [Chloroflexota bacterium]